MGEPVERHVVLHHRHIAAADLEAAAMKQQIDAAGRARAPGDRDDVTGRAAAAVEPMCVAEQEIGATAVLKRGAQIRSRIPCSAAAFSPSPVTKSR